MKKVLIFGATGYFGTYYCSFNNKFELVCDNQRLDKDFRLNLDEIDCVLYLAAKTLNQYKSSDFLKVNCDIPIEIAKQCFNRNIHFIYFSSELVFQGDNKFDEISFTCPRSFFGFTKAYTENMIKEMSNVSIIRTSLLYGYKNTRRDNLINYLRNCVNNNKDIEVFADSFVRPTHVKDLSEALDYVIENRICGLYHLLNEETVNRYDFAKCFLEINEISNILLKKKELPPNSQIEKNIDINCSNEFKCFFKTDFRDGLKDEGI